MRVSNEEDIYLWMSTCKVNLYKYPYHSMNSIEENLLELSQLNRYLFGSRNLLLLKINLQEHYEYPFPLKL